MKPMTRICALIFVLLCILLIVLLAGNYFISLLHTLGGDDASISFDLPMPILLLFGAAVLLAFGLALLIVLRSLAKIRRKEAAFNEEADEEETW